MDHTLELALYGDAYSVFTDRDNNYELTRYRRASFPGDGYQGATQPRPVLTGYRGFQGPMAAETFFYENGKWLNCVDDSEWKG